MPLTRTVMDLATGELVHINQVIYVGPNGEVILLDEGSPAPEGYTVAEELPPDPSIVEEKAAEVRAHRDVLFRTVYDPGVLMVQRYIRMTSDPGELSYFEGKLAELDAYAVLLQDIPEQPTFPHEVTWPVAPTP